MEDAMNTDASKIAGIITYTCIRYVENDFVENESFRTPWDPNSLFISCFSD